MAERAGEARAGTADAPRGTGDGAAAVRRETFWDDLRYGADGLVTVVVQDRRSGDVLMVAHADREAARRTAAERRAWFWSRSRRRLWRKGESSGHVQDVAEVRWDCDADALLYLVDPAGPACHTGARSCFFRGERLEEGAEDGPSVSSAPEPPAAAAAPGPCPDPWAGAGPTALGSAVAALEALVGDRARRRPAGSYVAGLLEAGPPRALQKLGEEAVEAVIAGLRAAEGGEAAAAAVGEFADLLLHAVAAMRSCGVTGEAVAAELARRHALRPPR